MSWSLWQTKSRQNFIIWISGVKLPASSQLQNSRRSARPAEAEIAAGVLTQISNLWGRVRGIMCHGLRKGIRKWFGIDEVPGQYDQIANILRDQ
jgi:hypothetical protein